MALLLAPTNDDCISFFFFDANIAWASYFTNPLLQLFNRFHSLAPFNDNQIRPGTVTGLRKSLPNFASAYETQSRVASTDGIFCSMYRTILLFRDDCSKELCVK